MAGKFSDRKMARSVGQAMYRYLPGRWIDFYIKSSRDSYSAVVTNWNSEKLEEANTDRIIREVWHRIDALPGQTDGFAPTGAKDAWLVLTPKTGDQNSGVFSEISPLMFFCSNPRCRRAVNYSTSDYFLKNYNTNRKCKFCNSQLTQVRMIYFCDCGWGGPVTLPKFCKCQGAGMVQKSTYVYACTKCHRTFELQRPCPKCGKMLFPKNALDNSHYYGHSFSLIDLVNMDQESFISGNPKGRYLAIAYWLGLITREKFHDAIQHYMHGGGKEVSEEEIQKQIETYRKILPTLPDDQLRLVALQGIEMNDPLKDVTDAMNEAENLVPQQAGVEDIPRNAALKILEYDTVLYAKEKVDIEQASKTALSLKEIDDTKRYYDAQKKAHFSRIQESSKVPFVTAVYGYSRRNNEIGGNTRLCAFEREKGTKSNIYATKMETEGVLFEVDRREILRWMQRNGWITAADYNDDMPEKEVKAWFLRNCDESKINTYGKFKDEGKDGAFVHVFTLLHSISHQLLREASVVTGLDKNSMAEYIFCDIPAIFIYCQNSQGFNLGAMQSAMEAKLDYWINHSVSDAYQCIFDPVCKEENGACAGCLFLNDISCNYFNRQLDRRYLIGHTDNEGTHTYGFWED